ncbi:type IV pilus modification PilV family protein [Thalassolituus sp. LLYu03]|uniref:type IV pilus modification PilV family protein n=1 Tax=Thalassolituus sp. LLYu03 TaxID=3421656 RepID=UPI003D2C71C8
MLNRAHSGFTMIEVLVTIAITVVGLLGISTLQLQSNRAMLDSGNRSQAIWMLEDLAYRMNANSKAIANYDTGGTLTLDDCQKPDKMCADYYNGGKISADICTGDEVAAFDVWDLLCKKNFAIDAIEIRESYADFIANPRLTIVTDEPNKRAQITVQWDVRTTSSDESGNKLYFLEDNDKTQRTDSVSREVQL